MQRYLIRRVALALPTLLGITIVVFGAMHFLPGNIVDQMMGQHGQVSPETRRQIEEYYQLDRPLVVRYLNWTGGLIQGDLGTSVRSGRPVMSEIGARIEPTLQLGIIGMIASVIFAIPIGVISAVRQASWIDYVGRSIAILFLAVPAFWLALMVITYGYVLFGWAPPIGYASFWNDPATNLGIILPPALILGINLAAITMRMTRSTMLEVLREDYIRTAMAKGLRERRVVIRHALRNALIPVITVIGTQIPIIVGGVVILERIFSLPGLGSYLLTSISTRDYPVVQAIVLLAAVMVVITNIIVDLTYTVVDPRIRME